MSPNGQLGFHICHCMVSNFLYWKNHPNLKFDKLLYKYLVSELVHSSDPGVSGITLISGLMWTLRSKLLLENNKLGYLMLFLRSAKWDMVGWRVGYFKINSRIDQADDTVMATNKLANLANLLIITKDYYNQCNVALCQKGPSLIELRLQTKIIFIMRKGGSL